MAQVGSSVPQQPKLFNSDNPSTYNLRIYHLGEAREGVFLRNIVCRSAKKQHQRDSPPDVKQTQPERVARSEARTEDQRLGSEGVSSQERGGSVSREAGSGAVQAGKRARTKLRRLVEANNLTVMFSLTFDTNEVAKVRTRDVQGDLADWEQARYHFNLFKKRVKRDCKKRGLVYDFIAVSELQKRGIQHFHLATALPYTQPEMLALWGYGTVWRSSGRASRRREEKRPGTEASYVARYVSKYLGKDMIEEPEQGASGAGGASVRRAAGKSRYHRARSLKLPFTEELLEPGDLNGFQEALERDGFEMQGEPFSIEKEGIEYGLWARSLKLSMESGDLRLSSARRLSPTDESGGLSSHLTYGQLPPIAETKPKNSPPEGGQEPKKTTPSECPENNSGFKLRQDAPVSGGSGCGSGLGRLESCG